MTRGKGWLRTGLALALIVAFAAVTSGCTRREHEVAEGLALARLLRRLAPEATDLLKEEQVRANVLRINLEESGRNDFSKFQESLAKSVDALIAIRDRRRELQRQVRQGRFESPLVNVVQHDAITEFQNALSRNDTWIQLSQNVQLRAELGRMKDFPEVEVLTHQLLLFLGEARDEPLGDQIQTLKNEYHFTDTEVGT